MPTLTASSTTYWMPGLSTSGSISLGVDFVAGRNRVPRPAAGMTAVRTRTTLNATKFTRPAQSDEWLIFGRRR
jgi:hypothetical protein